MNRVLVKMTSFKNLLVLWAIAMITYIVMADKASFNNVAMLLAGVVITYLPVNVYQKKNQTRIGENSNEN